MKQRIFCVLNTHTLAGVTIDKKPEVFLVLLSVGETIVDWPVFCGVGIINYLSLFCTTSSFKIRNTKKRQVSSHAPKITDNRLCVLPRTNPGLFPLSSSLEVKRNWDSCKNQIIRKTPLLNFVFVIAFGFITRSPHFLRRAMLCQKSTYLRLYCLKFNIVQGGKEEVASPVLLLLYVKCPNTFDLHCKESRVSLFRGSRLQIYGNETRLQRYISEKNSCLILSLYTQ